MTRLYGRARRGERLHASALAEHWGKTTMISAIRLNGSTADMTIESPTNGDIFETYVREILLPTLGPGDLVIMDNLSAHKRVATRELIETVGAEVIFFTALLPRSQPH